MRFDQLPLLIAVHETAIEMNGKEEFPGSDNWTSDELKRMELTKRVVCRLINNADQEVIDMWIKYRKSRDQKMALIAEVAALHGSRCAYAHRGKGECSSDIHLDRIVPGSMGGEYTLENCQIACGRHNTMRGDSSIEAFLGNN